MTTSNPTPEQVAAAVERVRREHRESGMLIAGRRVCVWDSTEWPCAYEIVRVQAQADLAAAREECEKLAKVLVIVYQHGCLLAHSAHWDKTGGGGVGCPICNEQRIAHDALRGALGLSAVKAAMEAKHD